MGTKSLMLMFGTFSPIHEGHLRVAKEIKEFYKIDYFRFIPLGNVPVDGQKEKKLSFTDRTEILKATLARELGNELYYDPVLENAGFSMYQTAKFFRGLGFKVSVTMGVDYFEEMKPWKDSEKLIEEFPMVVFGDEEEYDTKEADFFRTNLMQLSSSEVRELILKDKELLGVVPKDSIELIKKIKYKFETAYK